MEKISQNIMKKATQKEKNVVLYTSEKEKYK